MQSPTGAKQSFAGTHSQAELGNDRVRGEAALRGTHSQAALGNDKGDDRGTTRLSIGVPSRYRGGIPDIFIPLGAFGNAGVGGGRNENSGMTTRGTIGGFFHTLWSGGASGKFGGAGKELI